MSKEGEIIDDFEFSIDGIEESTDTFEVDFNGESIENTDTFTEATEAESVEGAETDNEIKADTSETFEVDEQGNTVVTGKSEEEVVATEDNTPSTDDKGNSSSTDVYSKFASALYQDGILDGVTEEDIKDITDGDKFAALISKTIKSNEYSDLGERGKEFLDAVRAGVPIEAVARSHNNEMQLNNLKEETFVESDDDEDDIAESKRAIREQLIFNDLRSRNIKEGVAKRMVAASFKEGADEEDAKNAVENLKETVKRNKTVQFEKAQAEQAQIQENRNALVSRVTKTEEIIPGIKVPEKMRSKIAKALTEPTGRDANGKLTTFVSDKRAENAELFDTRLNYYIELGLFNEKPDLSIFGKQKMSSAVSKLEKDLGNDIIYEGGRGASLEGIVEKENQAKLLSLLDNTDF